MTIATMTSEQQAHQMPVETRLEQDQHTVVRDGAVLVVR